MSDMQIRITGDGSGGERAIRANENALSRFRKTIGQVGATLRGFGLLMGFRMIASAVNEIAANTDKVKGIIDAAQAARIKQFAADMQTASLGAKALGVNMLAALSGAVREDLNFVMAALTGADIKTAWQQRKGLANSAAEMAALEQKNLEIVAQQTKDAESQAKIDQLKFSIMTREQQVAVLNEKIAGNALKTKQDELSVVEMLVDRQRLLTAIENDRAKQAAEEAERAATDAERAADIEAERLDYLTRGAKEAYELATANKARAAAENMAVATAVKDAFQGEGGLRGAMRAARDKNREEAKWNRAVGLAGRNLARQGINPNDPSTWRKLSQADRRDLMLAQAGGVINQQGNPEALAAKAVDSLHETVKARLGFVGGA